MILLKNMRNLVVIVLKSEDHTRAGSEVVSLSVFFLLSGLKRILRTDMICVVKG